MQMIDKSEYSTIVALYQNGVSGAEIARTYNVSRERIRQIISDNYPQAIAEKKMRRAALMRRRRTCKCGAQKSHKSQCCLACAGKIRRVWTRDLIVERMQEFNKKYGRGPSATDFSPALARQRNNDARARIFESEGRYPSTTTVVSMFGTWNKAMDAAGLKKNARGRPAGTKTKTLV